MGLLSKALGKLAGATGGLVKSGVGTATGSLKARAVKTVGFGLLKKAVPKLGGPAGVVLGVGLSSTARVGFGQRAKEIIFPPYGAVKTLQRVKNKYFSKKQSGIVTQSSPVVSSGRLPSGAIYSPDFYPQGPPANAADSGGYSLSKALKTAGGIAAGAAALYGIEQVAEKFGVRGGAGFIGRRPKKRAKSRTRRRSSRPTSSRRVSFTTKDGRRVSFTPRNSRKGRSTLRFKRKRGRRGRGVSQTEFRKLRAMINRFERD